MGDAAPTLCPSEGSVEACFAVMQRGASFMGTRLHVSRDLPDGCIDAFVTIRRTRVAARSGATA